MATRLTQFTDHLETLMKLVTSYPVYEKYSALQPCMKTYFISKTIKFLQNKELKPLVIEEKWDNIYDIYLQCEGTPLLIIDNISEMASKEKNKDKIKKEILILIRLCSV